MNFLIVHMGMYASTIRLNAFLELVILARTRNFFISLFLELRLDTAEGWPSVGQGCIPLV